MKVLIGAIHFETRARAPIKQESGGAWPQSAALLEFEREASLSRADQVAGKGKAAEAWLVQPQGP